MATGHGTGRRKWPPEVPQGYNRTRPNSDFAVGSAGTLDVNGIGQTVANLNNAGFVNMGTATTQGDRVKEASRSA